MRTLPLLLSLCLLCGCSDADSSSPPIGGFGGDGGQGGAGGVGGSAGEGGTGGQMALAELLEADCVVYEYEDVIPEGDRLWDYIFEVPVQVGDVLTMAYCGQYYTRDGERTDYFPGCDIWTTTITEVPRIAPCGQGWDVSGVVDTLEFEAILYLVQ